MQTVGEIIGYVAGVVIVVAIAWLVVPWVLDTFIDVEQNIGGASGKASGKFVVEQEPAFGTNSYGAPIVTGQIRNNSGKFLDFVRVNCQIYEGALQIESASDSTSGLAAGSSWRYEARLATDSPGADYDIECQADG